MRHPEYDKKGDLVIESQYCCGKLIYYSTNSMTYYTLINLPYYIGIIEDTVSHWEGRLSSSSGKAAGYVNWNLSYNKDCLEKYKGVMAKLSA